MINIKPELLNPANLKMICNKCNYTSSIYVTSCPKCEVVMIPFELKKFLKFNEVLKEIEKKEILKEVLDQEIIQKIFKDNSDKIEAYDSFRFIITYIKFYNANFLYEISSLYFKNFKKLLTINYLYLLDPFLLEVALPTSVERIGKYKQLREKYSRINDVFEKFTTEEVYFFIRTILKHISIKSLFNKNTPSERIFVYNIILDALNELFSKLESQTAFIREVDQEISIKFKDYLHSFSMDSEQTYRLFPGMYRGLINTKEFPIILLDFDLDFIFLPKHDKYALVKKKFSPDVMKIERLNEKIDGITLKDIAALFNVPLVEAEIIIQVLLKRRLGIKTYSYLRGDRFFIV